MIRALEETLQANRLGHEPKNRNSVWNMGDPDVRHRAFGPPWMHAQLEELRLPRTAIGLPSGLRKSEGERFCDSQIFDCKWSNSWRAYMIE